MGRMRATFLNSITSMLGRILTLVLNFVVRIVFVRYLDAELLGVNGLFTNIIQVLSFAELGIGTAFTFALYKPLASHDYSKLNALMRIFKKSYIVIGSIILVAGLSLTNFLPIIIQDVGSIENLPTIYTLFILNTSFSYFFSYNRSLLIADQKLYITIIVQNVFQFIMSISQIIILVFTQNYILFLSAQIISTVLQNIFITLVVRKHYGYILAGKRGKLGEKDKKNIIKNIQGLVVNKLGTIAVLSTDNIIISIFIGISQVGIYSNYTLILTAVKQVINQIFGAAIASIGNLTATSNKEHLQLTYKRMLFLSTIITGISSVIIFNLLNPIVLLFFGVDYLFSKSISLLITIEFYFDIVRIVNLTFSESLGLFWYTRYKSLLEGIVNLSISIILVNYLGISGIIIGTICSKVFVSLWYEPLILYRHGLHLKLRTYIKYFYNNLFISILIGLIVTLGNDFLFPSIAEDIILRLIFTIVMTLLGFTIIYIKSEYFIYFKNMLLKLKKTL
ncbi:lipopolysaccharide biosynthesis protein [Jeotgalibaca sp. A127]|uniref:lipopolysaccharide biosynthesis protein n=1 Tax=Jeotgalibaca sp. A127 TaxID=3457324 RepID=UPI003FD0051E